MKKISKINIVFILFILLLFAFGLFQNTSVLAYQSEDSDMRSILLSEVQPDFDVKQLFSGDEYFSTTNYEINDYTDWFTVIPTSVTTTEAPGGTDTFTVVLNSQPTADVTIGLSSDDLTEGTVSPTSLTFTSSNWNNAQEVTVTGVNDDIDDDNQPYNIVLENSVSADPNFDNIDLPDVSVTNQDDDTSGVTVTPTSGLTSTEAGGTATFTVVLDTEPTASVTIGLSSNDVAEGTASPSSLTFTSSNWATAQTVTVTGVDDDIDDGNIGYSIITSSTSSDDNYNGITVPDVSVTNEDNDTAGVTVTPTLGLTTTEAGGTATFTVVLNTEPTANVTIGLSSNDLTEGMVSPASLTFTSSNWATAQTVTVTGENDDIDDGNQAFTITTGATSTDSKYNNIPVDDVSVTNEDDDTAGVTVTPTSGLTTTEIGGTATFTVVLNTEPIANVTIGLSSNDLTEGTVSTSSLTYTNLDWNIPQEVTVTGVNDDIDDGNNGYLIITSSTSSDIKYNGITVPDVSVTNEDNDTAGVTVTPTSGLTTTEVGGVAQFSVRLNTEPSNDLVLSITSQNESEGLPNKTTLTFTNLNWNSIQTVTVTGQDDQKDDGDILYTVSVGYQSGAGEYSGLAPVSVSLTNIDNDQAGLIVEPLSGLTTSEDGVKADFSVKLATQPTLNVVLSVFPSDATEGTVDKPTLTFTNENWNINQVVTVTGVDDSIVDGLIAYTIQLDGSSGAPEYMSLGAVSVQIQNQDNDIAGVVVTPGDLTTTEAGGTAQFTISLSTQPSSPVTINLSSSDSSEGLIIDPVNPTSVVLNSTNWSAGVVVTIQGQNDDIDDGDKLYTIELSPTVSADLNYNNIDVPDKSVTNVDNDIAGVTITKNNLITNEGGKTDTFGIYLNTEPTHDVTINITNWDSTEGSLSLTSLVFTPQNYNTQQTVTVTGVDDFEVDGDIGYIIGLSATSSDPYYNVYVQDVSVTNTDDDIAGISINPKDTTMLTSEDGTTAQFTVVLDAKPYGTVTIPVVSNNLSEGIITTPASGELEFSSTNWNIPQQVIITGVDDDLQDGSKDYEIELGDSLITDGRDSSFAGLTKIVYASNSDNDTAGVFITQTDGLVTSETGQTAQFSLKLNTQPLYDVKVELASTIPSEGTITVPAAPHTLTFNDSNWSVLQQVTITGVDDILADGDQTYQITFKVTSAGIDYNNMLVSPVNIVNLDDDFSPIAVEDTYYINEEVLVIEAPGVLINDTDENDNILTTKLLSGPIHHKSFHLNEDGSFSYQAESGFEGTDTFTYQAFDGISYSEETTVIIHVDITPPPVADWVSPVTNGFTYTVQDGTVQLKAKPRNLEDFSHLWYAWYDPTIPGTIEDQLVDLGSAYIDPYAVSLNVGILDIGYNQIYVFAYDKAGNRSPSPNNRIIIERLPYYNQFIYLPIINK